jgi:hypothetical protein
MRRQTTYTVTDEGRDKGRTFIITEMSADAGERWATQAMYLLVQAGNDLPNGASEAGMAGLAATGIDPMEISIMKALQDTSLDSLWDCVKYQHNPEHAPQPIFSGDACQIEEIKTRRALRMEVLKIHLNPFVTAEGSNSAAKQPTKS